MPHLKSPKTGTVLTPPGVARQGAILEPISRVGELFAPTVLVVDDHADSRIVARLVLESAGFRVIEAATGDDGLGAALATKPLVVLLDMVLPGLDGWEVARRLRRDPSTCDTTIIAVTALASPDDQDRARLAGCDEVLTKPVPPSTMLRSIRDRVGLPVPAVSCSC